MVEIRSERAKKLLQHPQAFEPLNPSQMRKYPSDDFEVWIFLERDQQNVKKMSFSGKLVDHEKIIFEAVCTLMKGRPITFAENLSLRECEAFLRDKNSEPALENLSSTDEMKFKKFFQWLRTFPTEQPSTEYQFSSARGPFRDLKLVDKVRELKAFLSSIEIRKLYQGRLSPELIDVDDLTVFVQAPYQSEQDRALFEELHLRGVATFQEENLNFIPEA